MIEVVGVTLKEGGKVYYFSANNLTVKKNVTVIVDTERGLQFGKVVEPTVSINQSNIKGSLKEIVRIATKQDYLDHKQNIFDAQKALEKCKQIALKLNLPMQIMDANYTFTRDQLVFRFISDNRIDFRELVKELASIYKTRIELRQVGVRDKAREIGGIGPCGRQLCCSKYSYDFDSVSINMAKNQNIALNPSKINGSCGRLLCCLKYEDDLYAQNRKKLPNIGTRVQTENGEGIVTNLDIINLSYKVDVRDVGIVEIKL